MRGQQYLKVREPYEVGPDRRLVVEGQETRGLLSRATISYWLEVYPPGLSRYYQCRSRIVPHRWR